MGSNNVIMKTLLKSVMPTVSKFVESGKIDTLMQELKGRYAEHEELNTGETVEIMITTEIDGCEYANIVVLTPELTVRKLLAQQQLSELIINLFNKTEE